MCQIFHPYQYYFNNKIGDFLTHNLNIKKYFLFYPSIFFTSKMISFTDN